MKKNTQIILIGVAIILVVILISKLARFSSDDQKDNNYKDQSKTPPNAIILDEETTTTKIPTTSKTTPTAKPKPTTPVLNYTEIKNKYNGYRFQFSNNCSSITPNSFVIKSGSKFMVDNQENKIHTFTFEKQIYIVKPYSYAIFTTKTSGTQSIFCDGVQRVFVTVAK